MKLAKLLNYTKFEIFSYDFLRQKGTPQSCQGQRHEDPGNREPEAPGECETNPARADRVQVGGNRASDMGETRPREDSITGGFLKVITFFTVNTIHFRDEASTQIRMKVLQVYKF